MINLAKTEMTEQLEKAIWEETNKQSVYCCFEVTIGFHGTERVDYMTFDIKGVWRCYEIKASKADFHSKASHTFVGNYNYYVLTQELYEQIKHEIPNHIGIYVRGTLVKNPKKQELAISEQMLKNSLIRSLAREAEKLYKSEKYDQIRSLKGQLTRAKNKLKLVSQNI